MGNDRRYRLFVYGTLLDGEPDHELLAGADFLGAAKTRAAYKLVEARASAGLIDGGDTSVVGELYELDAPTLARCDLKREHPVLYQRRTVALDDGTEALAYFFSADQVRGCRRVRDGDWRRRFVVKPTADSARGPFTRWTRSRYSRR
ncbi:MAG: gamma-glutamylcyclotransferase [Deltaproteobacteria bacterium]|jgi:gamma-glutamylcyclotransferase (GGCT)/AIG2-like uncharacterized protein YtfP|nr:gamma-glutamylcyclotransferase [Deltaproteobacteria bacterium]MBW2530229.1 gamma-glutamylcyclotransferase [Deltaproteobacteria bacterium]